MDPEQEVGAEGASDDFDLDAFDWSAILGDEDEPSTDEPEDEDVEQEGEAEETAADDEGDEPEAEAEGEPERLELHTIKWKGQDRQVTTDELISLAQQGEDYTQKTQALAAERDAAAAYKALTERLAADPLGTIEALRAQFGAAAVDVESLDPLERELHEVKQRMAAYEAAEADRQVTATQQAIVAELEAVKQRYEDPELDEDALLGFAVEHNLVDLDVAYRAMTFEQKQATSKAVAAAEASRQAKVAAKRSAPPVTNGSKRVAKTSTSGASSKPTIREALAETLRELTNASS